MAARTRPPRYELRDSAQSDRFFRNLTVGIANIEPESITTSSVAGATAASNGTFYRKVAGELTFAALSVADMPAGMATDAEVTAAIAAATTADAIADAAAFQPLAAVLSMLHTGTGTPEGALTAPVGHVFLRTDGGASTTMYIKESGAGNTGWRAV